MAQRHLTTHQIVQKVAVQITLSWIYFSTQVTRKHRLELCTSIYTWILCSWPLQLLSVLRVSWWLGIRVGRGLTAVTQISDCEGSWCYLINMFKGRLYFQI